MLCGTVIIVWYAAIRNLDIVVFTILLGKTERKFE